MFPGMIMITHRPTFTIVTETCIRSVKIDGLKKNKVNFLKKTLFLNLQRSSLLKKKTTNLANYIFQIVQTFIKIL